MNYLDKDEILSKLGLETKPSTGEWLAGSLATFGLGLLVGAGVALLIAPKSGRQLRRDIRDKINETQEAYSGTMGSSSMDDTTHPGRARVL